MSTLTERYVHAATRFVQDSKERDDLALELRERIDDTVAALEDSDLDHASAERQALTDLGDPLRLSAEYRQRPMHLIGPRVFYTWLRVTLIAVCSAAPVVGIISTLGTASSGAAVGEVIASGLGSALTVALHCVFWVTLFFAVAERVAPTLSETWNPDMLPASVESSSRRTDMIASLVALTLAAALLVWQHIGSPFIGAEGRIPVFSPDLWSPWLAIVLVLLAAEALHAVWLYRAGWTWPVAAVNAVIAVAFAAVVVPLLLQHRVLNPELITHLGWAGATDRGDVIAAVAIIAITVWEIGNGLVKAARRAKA